jgi:hypothetical protein
LGFGSDFSGNCFFFGAQVFKMTFTVAPQSTIFGQPISEYPPILL